MGLLSKCIFRMYWKDICHWSKNRINNNVVKGVIVFELQDSIVYAYLYTRMKDGSIIKEEIPVVKKIEIVNCPLDIQFALLSTKEIIVNEDASIERKEPIIQLNFLKI